MNTSNSQNATGPKPSSEEEAKKTGWVRNHKGQPGQIIYTKVINGRTESVTFKPPKPPMRLKA